MSSLPAAGDTHQRVSYLPPDFINLSLPNTRFSSHLWVRNNGPQQLMVTAGAGIGVDGLESFVPYGKYARAALLFICTEAVRTGQPVIPISTSYRGFMKQLGLSWSRHNAAEAVRQMQAVAASTIALGTMSVSDAGEIDRTIERFRISFKDHMVFTPHSVGELSENTPSSIELSPEFMQLLAERGKVPLRTDAWLYLVQHSKAAMTLDIYTWLSYRLHRLNQPTRISWDQLWQQFGSESELKKFKPKFQVCLRDVMVVYPEANVTEFGSGPRGGTHGLMLKMSKNAMDSDWIAPKAST